MRRLRPANLAALLVGWGLAIAYGNWRLFEYSTHPSPVSHLAETWPGPSRLARNAERMTLVLFVHPQCACSLATLANLARSSAHYGHKYDLHICFVLPPGKSEDWTHTTLWTRASQIPGAQISIDAEGAEARIFGALTSGQALLYDAAGRIVFAGGLTPTRAHEGDCAGTDALLAIAAGKPAEFARTEVYGCGLFGPQEMAERAGGNEPARECQACPK